MLFNMILPSLILWASLAYFKYDLRTQIIALLIQAALIAFVYMAVPALCMGDDSCQQHWQTGVVTWLFVAIDLGMLVPLLGAYSPRRKQP